ncbi:MAG: HAMP domain-containing protein [Lachnospiraceae bacterium]|nr:HAMP domain-containing protein [Lachnospiraceae bacterium]
METKNDSQKIGFFQSIRFKLIVLMVLIAAVPMAISVLISYNTSYSMGSDDAKQLNLSLAKQVQGSYLEVIETNVAALNTLAGTSVMQRVLDGTASDADKAEAVKMLQDLQTTVGDKNSAAVTGLDGMQVLRSSGDCVDVSSRDYYQKGIAGETYVSDVVVSKTTGACIIVIEVPVKDGSGKVLGFIQRNYDLKALQEMLQTYNTGNMEIMIADRAGLIVADTVKEITAENMNDNDVSGAPFFNAAEAEGSVVAEYEGKKSVNSFSKDPLTGMTIVVARTYQDIMAGVTRSTSMIALIGIVLLVIVAALSIFMASNFTKPIGIINETMSSLAAGEFKQVKEYANRRDEFGQMIKATNSLVEKLGDIVTQIKDSAAHVNESSNDLAETAKQISQTADDVSTAVVEIASGASQQADEIQNATDNTSRISDNIQRVTDSAEQLNRTAETMDAESKESVSQLDRLQNSSREMAKAVDDITQSVSATGAAVDRISTKVAAINSIASQTNLLALNASIEAARAGEAGRGFAVVAEEIGHLSDDSAASANEIRAEMTALFNEAQSAVKKADEVKKVMEEQNEILVKTIENINALIEEISNTVSGVKEITENAEACDQSKVVIVDAMDSLSAISEENAASSEETSASMQELNATVNILSGSADSLQTIAHALLEEISFFKI